MKLVLAPMATLSHEALRVLIHRYGDPDEYFSEMINATTFVGGGRFEKWYIRTDPAPEKMVWQLNGSDAAPMARAAGMLARLGGIGLDLNMGCSAPEIVRGGAGIAWMLKPVSETADLVRQVHFSLDEVIGAGEVSGATGVSADSAVSAIVMPGVPVPFRLSVKLRLGADENWDRLLAFCRMLIEEGVELITLHPRIKSDKYGRPARREFTARLAASLSVPVYGNGDIHSPEDACAYHREYPCAGLMIGRSAVQKPWLFRDIKNLAAGILADATLEPVDHLEVANFFLENLALRQPPEFQLTRMHRFFFYYCDNFSFAHHIKMRIQKAESPDAVRALLEEYFEQVPADRYLCQGKKGEEMIHDDAARRTRVDIGQL